MAQKEKLVAMFWFYENIRSDENPVMTPKGNAI
jgi:hypothetical protein